MIAVSYLMKRKTKKIFVEVISNIKISYIKFWLFDFSNDQDFAKLTGGLDKGGGLDNVEYGNTRSRSLNLIIY